METQNKHRTFYRTLKVDGLDIFYREAGSRDEKTILLLHGFPTSSQRLSTPSRRSWVCIDIASI